MARKEEPHLRIRKIEETHVGSVWRFYKYKRKGMSNIENRMLIRFDHRWGWGLVYSFPFLHENGIDDEIRTLQLAKEAIGRLKKRHNKK